MLWIGSDEGIAGMKQEISNPHDKLFKQLLGEPENAASFLASNLPGDLVSHLDLSTLQVVQVSFIDTQFIQSEADLLFSLSIADRPGYVYFLFEHQSSPDAFMMLRLLGYMVRVWKRFQSVNPRADRLPPIIPMVLFHGPKGRHSPLTFQALVDIPAQGFMPYIPDFQCRLFDLSPFGLDRLTGNTIVRILGDLLGAFGRTDFQERVTRALATLNELSNAPGFARYLEILFRYILQVFDIPREEINHLVTKTLHKTDVKEFRMTTYEQLIREGEQIGMQKGEQIGMQKGEQIGMQKGEQIGIQKGVNLVLAQLISKKFQSDTETLMPLLGKLSAEQQEQLIERILLSQNLEEILEWLRSFDLN